MKIGTQRFYIRSFSRFFNSNSMIRFYFFILSVVTLCSFELFGQSPNVLLIIADDVGNGAIPTFAPNGPNQVKASMPNLEELIENGLSFENLWVAPSCSPTRASILTGKYGFRTGVLKPGDNLATSEYSLFQALEQSESDYATALIGKWHLSPGGPNSNIDQPYEFGLDYFAGMLGGGVQNYYNWNLVEDGVSSASNVYTTEKLTDLTIDWIEAQEQPWFCWLAYTTPHSPYHLPPSATHTQGDLPTDSTSISENTMPYFIAMIENLDFELGRIKESMTPNEWDNTVVIFIGDNGTPNNVILPPYNSNHGKGSCFQGGVNTPMVIAGPGIERANEREEALINSTDLFSTILSICGGPSDDYEDSKSFSSLLATEDESIRDCVFVETSINDNTGIASWAIRGERYKYLLRPNGQESFFDLVEDPYENNNLINSMSAEQQTVFDELVNKHMNLSTGIDQARNPLFYQYPNPVSDVLFIETPLDQELSFMITDLEGKAFLRGNLQSGKNKLSLTDLPVGTYIFVVPGYARRLLKR